MDGLIAKSVLHFLEAAHGVQCREAIASEVDTSASDLQSIGQHDTARALEFVACAARNLNRETSEIWEDIGTHLVTHPDLETVRRLLRFGGADFKEFLWSLDDLYDRAQLAVRGMDLPNLRLEPMDATLYSLRVSWPVVATSDQEVAGPLVLGALRAMADDYGALVFLELVSNQSADEAARIEVNLLEAGFAPARDFHLGMETAS